MPEVHNFPTSCKSTKKTGSVGDILKKIIAIVRYKILFAHILERYYRDFEAFIPIWAGCPGIHTPWKREVMQESGCCKPYLPKKLPDSSRIEFCFDVFVIC